MRFAPRHAPTLFALIMSCLMAFIMTAFITWVNTGMDSGYITRWMHSFILAWPLAAILILLFANKVRALSAKLISQQ